MCETQDCVECGDRSEFEDEMHLCPVCGDTLCMSCIEDHMKECEKYENGEG